MLNLVKPEVVLEYTKLLVEADIKPSAFPFEFFIQLRKEGLV